MSTRWKRQIGWTRNIHQSEIEKMKIFKFNQLLPLLLLASGMVMLFSACEDDEIVYEPTRLFQPVLSENLMAELNTIIVNLGNSREAVSYTIEVSRDTFETIIHTIESDTNYVVINEETLNGQSLRYGTLYQIRATAHAADPVFDSRPSDLGGIRTERFPSILQAPTVADILDVQTRVNWTVAGAPVTFIRVFTLADELLENPLFEFEVDQDAQDNGVFIIDGLQPMTEYQVAIYSGASGDVLRGWEPFTTIPSAIDLTDPNVIDLSNSMDADTLNSVIRDALDGQIIVLKKGFRYNLPTDPLDKSITITAAYGFGSQKAMLYTTGNWNFAEGAMINHVKFIDVEIRGEDFGGDYVFNPNVSALTVVDTLLFDNCVITNLRGIARIRSQMFLRNFSINNSVVDSIGNYGILTADTDGVGNAAFDNVSLTNSTFSRVRVMFQTRQNAQSVLIDGCTFSEFTDPSGIMFRWRGEAGLLSNVFGGITITNSIFGHAWDQSVGPDGADLSVRGIHSGLEATSFNLVNNYATLGFSFTEGSEIPGFPSQVYNGTADQLWVAPYGGENFNFEDTGFAGRSDSGDPRWRLE